MHTPSPSSLLALSLLSAGLVACGGDPPPPSDVRARLTADLGHVLREAVAATDGATATLPGGSSFGLLERALGQGGSSGSSLPPMFRELSQRFTRSGTHTSFAPGDTGIDTDALVAELNEKIFTDANHLGDGIYKVPVDLMCTTTSFDDMGNETTGIDPECADQFAAIDLRIRVEEDGSELTFAIQVGAGHDEPLEVALTHTSLAVTVDLDAAEAATETIASAFGQSAPNARLAGRFTGKLTVLGTAHVEAGFTINRAIDVAVAEDGAALDGPDAFRVTSAAAQVATVEIDGTAGVGSFDLDAGATTVHTPGVDGFDLDLPGASISADLAEGQPLHLTHISLGDRTTTVSMNGAVAISIDLNPNDGRSLEATITSDATGETVSVSPKLDARIAINHTALGDSAGVYDVTRVLFDGTLRSSDANDQVEVVTGGFSIMTNPASYGFSATAGQCVSSTESLDATTDQYYTQWSVGTCF